MVINPEFGPTYCYAAKLSRVKDGDTFVLDVDLGFYTHQLVTVRLLGYNAPELKTEFGPAAMAAAEKALSKAQVITVQSYKGQHSFERWLADVWIDGKPLRDVLVAAGAKGGWSTFHASVKKKRRVKAGG